MKLFLLTQTINDGYETYDSCIVAAENEAQAVLINPSGGITLTREALARYDSWSGFEDVSCKLIGEADSSITEPGVIVASFNAG